MTPTMNLPMMPSELTIVADGVGGTLVLGLALAQHLVFNMP
jgi:hypothetical protein